MNPKHLRRNPVVKRERLSVLSNKKISEGHYILAMRSARIAEAARPGQFVQIGDTSEEIFLPRPFSFLDVTGDRLQILYQVVGKGTALLSQKKPGDSLWVLGPLGNGFGLEDADKFSSVIVGGGVGIPPLYHLTRVMSGASKKAEKQRAHVFLGGRTKAFLHCEKDFAKLGTKPIVATDDGSKGVKGRVTEPLEDFLVLASKKAEQKPLRLYACGPTPMLRTVRTLSVKFGLACQVSVEEPMPCGFGVCLGCAIKVRGTNGTGHRYAMSCTEGPVFDADKILWEE